MFIEKKKVNFNKGGSGSIAGRVILPAPWLRHLGINIEERDIVLELEGDKIIIKKDK